MSRKHDTDEDERQRHHRALELFIEALKLRGAEREALLAGSCEDETLRREVESLLQQDESASARDPMLDAGRELLGGLRAGGAGGSAADDSLDLQAGTRIGPYRLLEKIGEGGFGSVFVAEQSEPVRRKVALKVIKAGMDTKEVIARFEAERNALSLMNHSSIARVYDAGATPAGRPYFVMEYVEGIPIHEFCDLEELALRERLRLFIDVCGAVQHAHQKGIIHRDLKPSNILVTMQDGRALPKIIDFGIAKATAGSLGDQTVFTHLGQLMGTPEYMSPEQAEMSGVGVDSTTDIYALGVVLYKLLTGVLPFEPETLRAKGMAEIHRILREEEPSKPSTRLTSLSQEETTTIGRKRGTDSRTLSRDLTGDLDWIVMRAMEKQRTRRYASASELAADVQRHLDDEPVLAGPPSATYRLRKFARRNRAGVAFSALALVLLAAGTLGTGWGMVRAADERDDAFAARGEAEEAYLLAASRLEQADEARRVAESAGALAEARRQEADAQRAIAVEEGRRARAVTGFLLDTLGLANPDITQLTDMSMRDVLHAASERVGVDFADHPIQEAEIRTVIGRAYLVLGGADRAIEHLRRARDLRAAEDPVDARAMCEVLWTLVAAERHEDSYDWVTTGYQLGAVQLRLFAEVMPELAEDLRLFMEECGKRTTDPGEVRKRFARILARGYELYEPGDERWNYLTHGLYSGAYLFGWRGGDPKDTTAAELILRALDVRREFGLAGGADVRRYTDSAITFYMLRAENFSEARRLAEEQLERVGALLGDPDHWYLASYKLTIGMCAMKVGDYEEAEPLLLEALEVLESSIGANALDASSARQALAELYEATGRSSAAATHREVALRECYDQTGGVVVWIAARPLFSPQQERAVELGDRFDEVVAEARAADEPLAARRAELTALVDEALAIRARLGIRDEDPLAVILAAAWVFRAEQMVGAGLHDLVERIGADALTIARVHPDNNAMHVVAASLLARSRNLRGLHAEAEEVARPALRAAERDVQRRQIPLLFNGNDALLRLRLGEALLGQGKLAEAEVELRDGLELSEALSIHPRSSFGRQYLMLIEVVHRRGRAEEAAELAERLLVEAGIGEAFTPSGQNNLAWFVVRVAGWDPQRYARALALAESAVAGEPGNPEYLNTLGVALYRMRRHAEALERLEEAARLKRASDDELPGDPADLCFIAMARQALGDAEGARTALALAREVMQRPEFAESAESRAFLAEAVEFID